MNRQTILMLLMLILIGLLSACGAGSYSTEPVTHPQVTQEVVVDTPTPTAAPEESPPAATQESEPQASQVEGDTLPPAQESAGPVLIAFDTSRDGEENTEIYVMDTQGKNLRNLTNHPAGDVSPAWSPDGATIAWVSNREGNYDIYTMAADGTNVRRLTDDPEADVLPAWSPDGSTIAFTSKRADNWEIYRMDADGANLRRLTTEAGNNRAPAWAPDGAHLLFSSDRAGNDDIYLMTADGSQATRLTDDPAGDIQPVWSPDGRQILFVSERDGNWEIYLMQADGTGVRRLTNNSVPDFEPSWSPDGETIVWQAGWNNMNEEIFAMKVDGSGLRLLTNHPANDTSARVRPIAATAIAFGGEPVDGDPVAILKPGAQPAAIETDGAEPPLESTLEPDPAATEAVGPVKIALLDALELEDGQARLNWARLAVEDFNAASGWNVELVEVDVGTDPATVMSAIDPVVGDRAVYAAIGPPFFTQIAAASAIFSDAGLPHIVLNGALGLTQQGNQTLFRMVPTNDRQGPAAARFIVNTLGAKKVFVIIQQGPGNPGAYGYELYTAFEQALNAAGGAIVGREPIAPDATDFSALIASIEASGAEAVFGADTGAEQGALIAQALREAGLDTPLVGHVGWADAPFVTSAEGDYVLSYAPAVTDPALGQRYTELHGPFGMYGPLTYAATMVALEAMQRAAESGQLGAYNAVRDEVANTSQANSILGLPIAFEANGDLKAAQFYLLQVENGMFRTIAP